MDVRSLLQFNLTKKFLLETFYKSNDLNSRHRLEAKNESVNLQQFCGLGHLSRIPRTWNHVIHVIEQKNPQIKAL